MTSWSESIDRAMEDYMVSVNKLADVAIMKRRDGGSLYGLVRDLVTSSHWVTNRDATYLVCLVSSNRDETMLDLVGHSDLDTVVRTCATVAMTHDIIEEVKLRDAQLAHEEKEPWI